GKREASADVRALTKIPGSSSAGRRWRELLRPSVADVDRSADLDPVVEVDHVGDKHAHASVREGMADRIGLVRAVDAGPVEQAHPARLQRIAGTGRDHLP